MIIAIEGIDKAGKYTQAKMLHNILKVCDYHSTMISFPDYSVESGKEIKNYLNGKRDLPPEAVHLLFAINMYAHVDRIRKASKGVVILNRYYHSNKIYGEANGLSKGLVESLDFGLPKPDMTILLDIPSGESFKRKIMGRDTFEKNQYFLQKIRFMYKDAAKRNGWKVYDATLPKDTIHKKIFKDVMVALHG